SVTWLVDGAIVGASDAPPYTAKYRLPTASASRTVTIEAQARDAAGNVGHATTRVFAIPDTSPPSAAVVVPKDGADLATSQDLLISIAGRDDVGVVRVEVLFDETVVLDDAAPSPGPGPGSFVTHAVVSAAQVASAAQHHITARAHDAAGNVGNAPTVTIKTHADKSPQVSLLSPSAGARVTSGQSVDVVADASDDVGISKVEAFADGTSIGVRSVAPFRFTFAPKGQARTVTLKVVATDSGGQTAEASVPVQVTLDDQPPLLAFRAPNPGSVAFAGRPLTVQVAASDNVGVAEVQLYRDGVLLPGGTSGNASLYQIFTWTLPTTAGDAGATWTLRAVAKDTSGLQAERTATVTISVDHPPKVSILQPPPGTPYKEGEDVTLVATAADDDGVVSMVGTSGGQKVPSSKLPQPGKTLDPTQEQIFLVRAPIISKGQPPRVGVLATDTGGNEDGAEVELNVAKDTSPPTAVMTSPIQPASGPFRVKQGGSAGFSVDVGDDVRVVRVAVVADGKELALDPDPLTAQNERYDEVRIPNPQGPGDILVSRTYRATFAGVASLASLSAGIHQVATRAYDAAGNSTDTGSIDVEIVPFVDNEAPRVSLSLQGVPNDGEVVAGSTVTVFVSVTDDGVIASFALTVDGQAVPVGTAKTGGSFKVKMPEIAPLGPRSVTFTAVATDSVGHEGSASLTRNLVEDQPPDIDVASPAPGTPLTEEKAELVSFDVQDDVGAAEVVALLSTRPFLDKDKDSGAYLFDVPAASGAGLRKATLKAGDQSFSVSADSGTVSLVAPVAADFLKPWTGPLMLSVDPGDSTGVVADVEYHYRRPDQVSTSAQQFEARLQGGVLSIPLSAPTYQATLPFPAEFFLLDLTVHLRAAGGSVPLVSSVGLAMPTRSNASVRAEVAGERLAASQLDPQGVRPGHASPVNGRIRVPVGWSPRPAFLTGVATDGHGQTSKVTESVTVVPDRQEPTVLIASPANGSTTPEGLPVQVLVRADDDVELASLELWVNGVRQQRWDEPATQMSTTLSFALPPDNSPVELVGLATDRAGNAHRSTPVYVRVEPDQPPQLTLVSLTSPVQQLTRAELDSGYVRLLQGIEASLLVSASDDIGLTSLVATYDGVEIFRQELSTTPLPRASGPIIRFTPKVGADGAPGILLIEARDARNAQATVPVVSARLVVESLRPQAPVVAIATPPSGATLAEGSIALRLNAIAGDDTFVKSIDVLVNGQPAARLLQGADDRKIQFDASELDANGLPIAIDPDIRLAAAALPDPYKDVTRLRSWPTNIALPPGFVALDPNRTETTLSIRVVATDGEGNVSSVDRELVIVQDTQIPVAEVIRPSIGQNLVEGTAARVQVLAHDNVFVDRVEILAGPSASQMTVVYAASGFPPVNALPSSPFDVYAPPVTFDLAMPSVASLGGTDSAPYLIGARARDVSGNWSEVFLQPVDVVKDRPPAVNIVSPSDGSRVVGGSQATVLVSAQDDVAIQTVQLRVNGVLLPVTQRVPPYNFSVAVPDTPGQTLTLQAEVLDTGGHPAVSPLVTVNIGEDRPPTVAIADPRDGQTREEGRSLAVAVGAQDDLQVTAVELDVEGGVGGALHYSNAYPPYGWNVPLPFGSAGRTLTLRARARDSAGHVSSTPDIHVSVVKDTTAPTLEFVTP
ncbi:MAG TPA: Ig-like domain-containing protein, partial [Myxococcaceae bacterium]|nr:Ig-like domain-containing protein [Myxococcaceae bacterium]